MHTCDTNKLSLLHVCVLPRHSFRSSLFLCLCTGQGQPVVGVSSLLPLCGAWRSKMVIRLGDKYPYLLSHLDSPCLKYFFLSFLGRLLIYSWRTSYGIVKHDRRIVTCL